MSYAESRLLEATASAVAALCDALAATLTYTQSKEGRLYEISIDLRERVESARTQRLTERACEE